MEQHKLAAARRVRKELTASKFCDFVTYIAENDIRIRCCYYRYLDFDLQTLAWMFAIDVSFLHRFLRERKQCSSLKKKRGDFEDCTPRKIWHYQAVLRDISMLENQIPLFLLRELHGFYPQPEEESNSDQLLASMLMDLCQDLAPIKHINERLFKEDHCFTRAHLLELLYHAVAPYWKMFRIDQLDDENQEKAKQVDEKETSDHCLTASLSSMLRFLALVAYAPIHFLVKISKSKIIMGLITLPLKVIAYFPKLRGKSSAASQIVSSVHDVIEEAEVSSTQHENDDYRNNNAPLMEEIAMPSVEELSKIGVQFRPTKGGLTTIKFDQSSATFHLPVIHFDENSEVVLRNLVAYEACNIAPERMFLTRYTELMNGITDTEEDVRILREAGILLNYLKSDKDLASLWNGMTTSVNVTKVPILDAAIKGANAYYLASWKVKVKQTMKRYVYASWPCLTFLAANILLWLSVVETVCTMHRCSKWMGT